MKRKLSSSKGKPISSEFDPLGVLAAKFGAAPDSRKGSPRLSVEPCNHWQIATANRTSASGPKTIILVERFPTRDPEDGEFRVWCEELLGDEVWSRVERADWEEGALQLTFPANAYEGMPHHLTLRRGLKLRLGSAMKLVREDGQLFAEFEVREVETKREKERLKFEARLLKFSAAR